MRRYLVTLIALNALVFALSARGQTPGSTQTYAIGPLTLCRGEVVEVLAYNPDTLSRSVDVKLVDFETGRTVDQATTYIGAQRGTRLGAGVNGVYVDDPPQAKTADCREAMIATVVIAAAAETTKARPVYFSGRFLSARDLTSEQTYGRHVSFGVVEMNAAGRATSAPIALDGLATLRIESIGSTSAIVTASVKDAINGTVVMSQTATTAAKKWLPSNFTFELGSLPGAAVVELEIRPETQGAELDARLAIAIETSAAAGDVAMEQLELAHEGFHMGRGRAPTNRVFFNYHHFHNAVSGGMQEEGITEEQLSNANEAEFGRF